MRSQQTVAARDADFVDDDFSKRLLKLTEAKDCSEASGWQAAFTKEAQGVILGLLGIFFWREGLEGAFGPEGRGGGRKFFFLSVFKKFPDAVFFGGVALLSAKLMWHKIP